MTILGRIEFYVGSKIKMIYFSPEWGSPVNISLRSIKINIFGIFDVDKHDWLISKYPMRFRSKKWYWPLVIRVLDMSLVNARIIYNHAN